jgi:hypothetical protein
MLHVFLCKHYWVLIEKFRVLYIVESWGFTYDFEMLKSKAAGDSLSYQLLVFPKRYKIPGTAQAKPKNQKPILQACVKKCRALTGKGT